MSEKYIIPTPGDVIAGKYHIEEELGRGAYGVVFRAHQEGIARKVALKTLLPKAFLETDIVERFEREARFVGRLSHPNIVGVHDYGRHENLLYMAVEYVEGEPLDDIIAREGPLEPERVRTLVYQIIDALEHAHQRGIVHRDLKPANIVIVPRDPSDTGGGGEFVKVLDFGIAKLIQSEAEDELYETLTQAGTVLGTPHYMSPETIVGDMIDHRADIYSLGVIMYEMLTGERPFGAKNSPGVMVKHLRDKPPALPGHLERSCWGEAVRGCLQKRPEDRIQSAVHVREILERRDEAEAAAAFEREPQTPTEQAPPKKRATGMVAAVAVGVVFALVLAALFHWIPGTSTSQEAAPAATAPAAHRRLTHTAEQHAKHVVATASSAHAASPAPPASNASGGADAGSADAGDAHAEHPAPTTPPKPAAQATAPHRDDTGKKHAHHPANDAPAPSHAHKRPRPTAAPKRVHLDLRSSPPGARVLIDGSPVGNTPLQHDVLVQKAPLNIAFSRIGYRTKYRTVVPDEDRTIAVQLEKGRLKLIP